MAHVFVIKRSNMRKDKIKNENIKENSGGLTVSRQVSTVSRNHSATSRICEVDIEKREEDIKIAINPDEKFNDESQKEDTFDFETEDMKGKINGTDDRSNQIGNTKELENLEETVAVGDLHKKTVTYVKGCFE